MLKLKRNKKLPPNQREKQQVSDCLFQNQFALLMNSEQMPKYLLLFWQVPLPNNSPMFADQPYAWRDDGVGTRRSNVSFEYSEKFGPSAMSTLSGDFDVVGFLNGLGAIKMNLI